MQCLTCDLTSICKIYEFISLQQAHADISVNNCRVKRTGTTANASNPTEEASGHDFKIRSAEAIASVTERIRELSAPPEPEIQETFVQCPECQQGARPSEITECEGCKKQLCIGCAVENSSDKKIYCEECWDNL